MKKNKNDILKEIRNIGPVVRGSVVNYKRTCGYKNCKCAKGEKHSAFYLSRSINGKTKLSHISKQHVEQVKSWKDNHTRLMTLIDELTNCLLEELKDKKGKET